MNLIAFGIVFLAASLVAAYLKIPIPVFSTVGDWLIGLLPFLGE